MQGLEFVDVPGLVILATGAGVMGAMLLGGLGWRKRDREAVERLHAAAVEIEAPEAEIAVDVCVEPEEVSGMRELMEPDYDDEITKPVRYTSADLARCREGLTVRPLRRNVI